MKRGISLIVLSITILVMAILAATAIISLENSGVIGRSKNTTTKQNQQEEYTRLQVIKNGILTDNLGTITVDEFIIELKNQGIIENTVTTSTNGNKVVKTKSGIEVYIKQDGDSNLKIAFEDVVEIQGLGALITPDNYGDTVDYSVTVNGTTYNNWRIYYHNSEYVYIMLAESVKATTLPSNILVSKLSEKELATYRKCQVGNFDKYTLVDTINGYAAYNSLGVAYLIKEYSNFGDTTESYKNYVEGAIGGPTIELLVAGWNAKGYTPTLSLSITTKGYQVTCTPSTSMRGDGFYISSDTFITYFQWIASPSYDDTDDVYRAGNNGLGGFESGTGTFNIHPVVCLKASIPAKVGTNGYDFNLVK